MAADDLIRRLAEAASDVAPALVPAGVDDALRAIAEAARAAFGAGAVSIAVLDEDAGDLHYRAAAGEGAEQVEGLRLALGKGIAGYVASTGQSLAVDEVRRDPRFAADVAERTGYVPSAVAAVPVVDPHGRVLGVLSVLDVAEGRGDLTLAGRFADAAAAVLPLAVAARDLGGALLEAVAAALGDADADLATALRGVAAESRTVDPDLAAMAAVFAELRSLGDREQHAALRLLEEFSAYARAVRRRR
ncbi:MAG: GAF domain-containing protein [Acidimicrobiia bacterium]|nr:GAF domain-containing protein [Acidimicrobiia bacterium]